MIVYAHIACGTSLACKLTEATPCGAPERRRVSVSSLMSGWQLPLAMAFSFGLKPAHKGAPSC